MAGKLVARSGAVGFFVLLHELDRLGLRGMRIRQLLGQHRRAADDKAAFHRLAAHAHQVARGGGVGLVDLAFVAALGERHLRHGGARAGGDDQDRLRVGLHQLERLAGHAGVGARKALDRAELDAGLFSLRLEVVEPGLAVGIRVAQKADALDALLLHVLDDGVPHHGVGLRQTEQPLVLARRHGDGRPGDLRCGSFFSHLRDGGGDRRGDRAHDDVDLVVGDKALGVRHALVGVGGVVHHDDVELFAGNGLGPQLGLVAGRNAEARCGARHRRDHADGDVGQRGARGGEGAGGHEGLEGEAGHGSVSWW